MKQNRDSQSNQQNCEGRRATLETGGLLAHCSLERADWVFQNDENLVGVGVQSQVDTAHATLSGAV